ADPTRATNLIVVDANAAARTTDVQVNGYSWSFPGVTSVVVTGTEESGATNTVRIQRTLQGVDTTVNATANPTEILIVGQLNEISGTSIDNVQSVLGKVTVHGTLSTSLYINDGTDPDAQTVTISSTGITGLVPGGVTYSGLMKSIEVAGGLGGNV